MSVYEAKDEAGVMRAERQVRLRHVLVSLPSQAGRSNPGHHSAELGAVCRA